MYLDQCESKFKNQRTAKQRGELRYDILYSQLGTRVKNLKPGESDEIEMINGSNEDEFTEAIAIVRERELLFGPSALLAKFGPLVANLCFDRKSMVRIIQHVWLTKGSSIAKEFCIVLGEVDVCFRLMGFFSPLLTDSQIL